MAQIQEYTKPSDIISLSWTSFSLLQPYYLRHDAKKIDENLNEYRNILKDFSRQNESIKGKLKVDGKEVFYDKGKELEKYLEREIVQANSISNFSEIVYERSIKERKQVLNKYINLTNSEFKKIDLEIQLEQKKEDCDKLKLGEMFDRRKKLLNDINKLNKLLERDMN